jgi:hypothetical protein
MSSKVQFFNRYNVFHIVVLFKQWYQSYVASYIWIWYINECLSVSTNSWLQVCINHLHILLSYIKKSNFKKVLKI